MDKICKGDIPIEHESAFLNVTSVPDFTVDYFSTVEANGKARSLIHIRVQISTGF
jgi:hypothetical protein